MKRTTVSVVALMVAVALIAAPGADAAKKKKKKKPKPYTSPEGIIAVPHTMLYASTSEVNSVTANEFEATCSIPATNGLDAYVYEVPKAYQKIESNFAARASSVVAHDMYGFFYDKSCQLVNSVQATGSVGQFDAEGLMPAGIAYVLLADFAGDPTMVHYELKP